MSQLPAVRRFESNTGVRIYRIPMLVFPNGFVGFAYLLLGAGVPTLVDTGSGFPQSNDDLIAGLQFVSGEFDEDFQIPDIERIIITHGHIDHFGGVGFMLEQVNSARVGIHRLDRRVLTAYEERVAVATKDLEIYLLRAGVKPKLRTAMMEMYGFAKQHFRSVTVDFDLEEDTQLDGMEFIHAPGHCPGQVCIRIGDVLLVADHVLSQTTPHQAPESITHYTGLGHYDDALRRVAQVGGIRLGLGGHEEPIEDLYGRVTAIRQSHRRKLKHVMEIVHEANDALTVSDISKAMYPNVQGYEILLAIEEAGAHIEYLYQRGYLTIANLDKFDSHENPVLLYQIADDASYDTF